MKTAGPIFAVLFGLAFGFLAFSVTAFGAWQAFGHPPPGAHSDPAGGMRALLCGGSCMAINFGLVAGGIGYWMRNRRANAP